MQGHSTHTHALSHVISRSESDPYFVYCALHLGKEKMIESQRFYFAAFAAVDALKRKHGSGRQRVRSVIVCHVINVHVSQRDVNTDPRHGNLTKAAKAVQRV